MYLYMYTYYIYICLYDIYVCVYIYRCTCIFIYEQMTCIISACHPPYRFQPTKSAGGPWIRPSPSCHSSCKILHVQSFLFFKNNTDDCMLQRPGTVTRYIYTSLFLSPSPPRRRKIQTWGRLPCFRHCLASLELLPVQPRLPLVPGSDKSVRQGSACRSAGEEAPPTADRPQKSKPSPCRPHGFVAPVGEGTRRSVHADRTGSSVPTSRSPHRGFCRNEALLTSLHVPRQRNVRCPVSELRYMSAVDDLYKHNLHRATQRAAQCF